MDPLPELVGSSRIDSKAVFCKYLKGKVPASNASFQELFNDIDKVVLRNDPKVSTGALANVHGAWYEWLITMCSCNYHVSHPESFMVFPLPSVNQFDVSRLYTEDLYKLVEDLRKKIKEAAGVQLITSNPDFVIIDPKNFKLPSELSRPIGRIDEELIVKIAEGYKFFVSKCGFEDIVGYISAKLSLRPDRRLQIPHEGSLMKAIYTHLQTRQWVIHPKGLKYYAFTSHANVPDRTALKTVATHSITTVFDTPQAAVDALFEIDSIDQCFKVFDEILKK